MAKRRKLAPKTADDTRPLPPAPRESKPFPASTPANPAPQAESPRQVQQPGFPIVGIGASAGGLKAFKMLFSNMPNNSGAAFILVPHLDPTHPSLMVELLARQTQMPVIEAQDGLPIEPNCVYIIPPNKYLAIIDCKLQLTLPTERHALPTAIDHFFRSLAADQGERAIGIILSGTSSHGTLGLKDIKLAGGMVMVQQPESAEYDQMPRSAIATGLVDYVLPPEEMPTALVKYLQHPYLRSPPDPVAEGNATREELQQVLAVIKTRTKYDFRSYRKNMLQRRVLRRMGLCHLENMADYRDFLRDNPEELAALYKDLLIGVTEFFRDPEAFQVLQQRVIPELVGRTESLPGAPEMEAAPSATRPRIRIWVPACASGEEAYSIAMLFLEQLAADKCSAEMQIFATDIDERSLAAARQGIYTESCVAGVSPERLQRFFTKIDPHHWQVKKQLREVVTFAPQNLISDAPFSKLDLISCRNLLIYLDPSVQAKVIRLFHFALNEEGFLLLGPSESIGREVDLFESISKKFRVFKRIKTARRELVDIPISASEERRRLHMPTRDPSATPAVAFKELMQRLILDEFAPAAVLINRKHEIVSVLGPLVQFLEFPPGEITHDLLALARPGLRTKIRAAVHKAVQTGDIVSDSDARVKRDGTYVACTITVKPVAEPFDAEGLLLVTFHDRESADDAAQVAAPARPGEEVESQLFQHLEQELKSTREDLQSTIEEYESSTEELKASNEEVMSMNEELQSANEELETSKEELQSLNEELSTVNSQLQEKVEELDRSHSDLTNLMASSDVATVFLDSELRIKRFTPPVAKLLNLRGTDLDRPMGDFALKFADDSLLDDCRAVLDKLVPLEKEVWTKTDAASSNIPRDMLAPTPARCYLRRILPYRTADQRIGGVVVNLFDITDRILAEARSRRLATVLWDSNDAVTVQDFEGRIIAWNRGAEGMYGYTEAEALLMNIRDTVPEAKRTEAHSYLQCIARNETVTTFETQRVTKEGRTLEIELTATAYRNESGKPIGVATTERDITEQKRLVAELQASAERLQAQNAEMKFIYDKAPIGLCLLDRQLRFLRINNKLAEINGHPVEQHLGRTVEELVPSLVGTVQDIAQRILATGEPVLDHEFSGETAAMPGVIRYWNESWFPMRDQGAAIVGFGVVVEEITDRKQAEEALRQWNEELQARVDEQTKNIQLLATAISHLGEGVLITSGELDSPGPQILFVNEALCRITGYSPQELVGQSPRMLQGKETDHECLERLKRELSANRSCQIELINYRKDGTAYDADLFITPLCDDQGRRTNFVSVHRDITERKRIMQALRESETNFRSFFDNVAVGAAQVNDEGKFARVNERFCAITGYSRGELLGGMGPLDLNHPADLEADRLLLQQFFKRELAIYDSEKRYVRRDGQIVWVHVCASGIFDSNGKFRHSAATVEDISERKRAEQTLRDSEERMRTILKTATDSIITIDEQGLITEANLATERMFGFARSELVGHNVRMIMPQPYRDEHDGYLARYLRTGEGKLLGKWRELAGQRKDGSTFPIGLSVSKVDDLGLFMGIIRDNSERVELQTRVLEIAAEEQRRIGQELHDGTGQELTGLSLIAGALVARLNEAPQPTGDGQANWLLPDSELVRLRRQSQRLAEGLVESNHHVQQLSHGIMPVQIDAHGLRAALEELATSLNSQHTISCRFESTPSVTVANNTTATHLYRIAQEAVNNAIKHGRATRIRISLQQHDDQLTLEVKDNGIGIEAANAERTGASQNHTGFGLAIMNYRAGVIGGTLRITPGEQGGTLVRCTLPNRGQTSRE